MPVNTFPERQRERSDDFRSGGHGGRKLSLGRRAGPPLWSDIIGRRISCARSRHGRAPAVEHSGAAHFDRARRRWRRHLGDGAAHLSLGLGGRARAPCQVEPDAAANRLNEGAVGPDGAFWLGTMMNNIADDDSPMEITATGRLYRYSAEVSSPASATISSASPTRWLSLGRRLVTADTLANALYGYRSNREPGGCRIAGWWWRTSPAFARWLLPRCRGLRLNAGWRGRLPAALCADGRIDRVGGASVQLAYELRLRGTRNATLFVTSARFTMTAAHLTAEPQEGGLFAVDVGVRGLPLTVSEPRAPFVTRVRRFRLSAASRT